MRDAFVLLLVPPVVFVLPWLVPLARGRRGAAALLFAAWATAWACAAWLWFGVGLSALVALGSIVVARTTIERG